LYGRPLMDVDMGLAAVVKGMSVDPYITVFDEYVSRTVLEAVEYHDYIGGYRPIYWGLEGDFIGDVWIDPTLRRVVDEIMRGHRLVGRAVVDRDWASHMAMLYLMGDAGLECIFTVTTQTAHLLRKYGGEHRDLYLNMAGDREPIYHGATWYTEVYGGSDLSRIETRAYRDGGVYRLNGVKYFTSNVGYADYILTLARMGGSGGGVKSLSLFLIPKYVGDKPNYRLVRLKEKLGTLNVPTGEVEFRDSVAYLIGGVGEGIYYALENLMISRLANSVGAVGIARRALAEVTLYSKGRVAFGKPLIMHELYRHDLARLDIESLLSLGLAFHAVELWSGVEDDRPPYSEEYIYARTVNHLAKGYTSRRAVEITGEAMELIGGRGFLREFSIERLHREALVTTIWEGSTNIHILDFIEAFVKKGGSSHILDILRDDMDLVGRYGEGFRDRVSSVFSLIDGLRGVEGELPIWRRIFFTLGDVIGVIGLEKFIDGFPDPGAVEAGVASYLSGRMGELRRPVSLDVEGVE